MDAKRDISVDRLESICLIRLCQLLEENKFHPKLINDLCKDLPDHHLEPILQYLIEKQVITDVTLMQFLIPSRSRLHMHGIIHIKNYTLKAIGYNCPNLLYLDLCGCIQVSNAVVRVILHGCHHLQTLGLDKCHRVTGN